MSDSERQEMIESVFGNFFDEWPIGLKILDAEGNILFANEAFENMLDYTEKELQELPAEDQILHQADIYKYRKALAETRSERLQYTETEVRHIRKDGELLWTELTHALIHRDPSTDTIRILERVVDISNIRRLRGELFQFERKRTLGQLAGGIAHEMNNLFANLSANLDVLDHATDETIDEETLRETTDRMRWVLDRGTTLTRQLTEFGHDKVGSLSVLNINDIVRETTEFIDNLFRHEIEVEIALDEETPDIRGVRSQIEQVLMNLYVNARDAMPEGGLLEVETRRHRVEEGEGEKEPGTYAVIAVSDTGVGLEETDPEVLFSPFFTTKEHGTGMGLSIVHGIVHDGNGYIDVHSRDDEGTTFQIYLPAAGERS